MTIKYQLRYPMPWVQSKKIKGHIGEILAASLLFLKGYRLLAMNFKGGFAEVDIIALKGSALVLVEVKVRQTESAAHLAIHPDQRKRLLKQAQVLQRRYKAEELRLDAILVFGQWPFMRHLKQAF